MEMEPITSLLVPFVTFKRQNLLLEILSFLVHKELRKVELVNHFAHEFINNPFNFKQIVSWPPSIQDTMNWNDHLAYIITQTNTPHVEQNSDIQDEESKIEDLMTPMMSTEVEAIRKIVDFLHIYPNLHRLEIGYSPAARVPLLADIIFGFLQKTDTITELQLQRTHFSNYKKLFEGIISNNRVKLIDLGSCKLEEDSLLDICEFIEETKSIEELAMKNNNLGSDSFRKICRAIGKNKSIKTIDFGMNSTGPVVGSVIEEHLVNSRNIQNLYLNNMIIGEIGTKSIAELLKRNQGIKELFIQKNKIGVKGGQYLGEAMRTNFGLGTLSIAGNQIGVAGIRGLTKGLIQNKKCSLSYLDISYNNIGDEGIVEVGKYIKTDHCKLRNLLALKNDIESEGILLFADYMRGNRQLVDLNVHRNKIGSLAINALLTALVEEGKGKHVIQKLNFYECELEEETALVVENVVPSIPSLLFLDLSTNKLGVRGIISVFRLLALNPPLQTVDISDNIHQNDDSKEGIALRDSLIEIIIRALTTNKKLEALHMGLNYFGDRVGQGIAKGLGANKSIQRVGLHRTKLTDLGLLALGEILKYNRSILLLELEWNNLTAEGIIQFIDLIEPNEHINFINLINLALPKSDVDRVKEYALKHKPNTNIRFKHWKANIP